MGKMRDKGYVCLSLHVDFHLWLKTWQCSMLSFITHGILQIGTKNSKLRFYHFEAVLALITEPDLSSG